MPVLLYGLFACYAVTGKCDLRVDSEGHDVPVFASLEDCRTFATAGTKQPPDNQGKWAVDEGHYYQCLGLTPMSVAALLPPADAPRPVYKTTAEALQRDFQANSEALTRKIGGALVEVSGTVQNTGLAEGTALLLSGDSWDVTAWLTKDGIAAATSIRKNEHVTLSCDRIGTLVAASARRAGVVEVRDCKPVGPGK